MSVRFKLFLFPISNRGDEVKDGYRYREEVYMTGLGDYIM